MVTLGVVPFSFGCRFFCLSAGFFLRFCARAIYGIAVVCQTVRLGLMSGQPGGFPGGSGRARVERGVCGGKAPGVDRCGNEGDVNGAYGTVAAAATAIGDATPAGSATVVNESEAVAAAATSQYLAALEESMEALWRHMGGSVRGSVAWRGDGGTMKTGTFAGQCRPK